MLLLAVFGAAWGQTTYKLEQVTSVASGQLYVFEQDGHVMNNSIISDNALTTTTTYSTTGLTGKESYVWKLESASGGYRMRNASLSAAYYLTNSSSTTISLGNTGSIWTFNFQEDETVLIQNKNNNDRFLGYTTATSYIYRAYSTQNFDAYPHAIKAYRLVDESGRTPIATINGISPTEIPQVDPATSFPVEGDFVLDATFADGVTAADYTITYTGSDEDILTVTDYGWGHYATSPNAGAVGPVEVTVTITPKNTAQYLEASATFTVNVTSPISIGALRSQTETGTYILSFEDDAVVTYVNGKYAYIQDRTGAILLFKEGHGLTAGQKVSGQATVYYSPYNGSPQITSFEGATLTDGTAPEPLDVTNSSEVKAWDFSTVLNRYYKFSGVTIGQDESGEYYFEYGDWGKVYLYGRGDASGFTIDDLTKEYDLVGFPTLYNEKQELTIFVSPSTDSAVKNYYLVCDWGNDITEFTYDAENDVYTLTKTVDADEEFWISDKESDGAFYGASENYDSTLSSSNNTIELQADGRNLKSDVSAELVFTLKKTETGLTLTVTGWPTALRGDLNGDGLVNIMDVNILINIILGKE